MSLLQEKSINIFEIKGLFWDHSKGKHHENCFFKNIHLKIPKGKIIAFVGPSGCGKTTLLQILGLIWDNKSIEGCIQYQNTCEGQDFLSLKTSDKNKIRSNDFGFILQNSYLIPHFSVSWNIALPLLLRGESKKNALKKANDLLKDLSDVMPGESLALQSETSVDKLSQGQRQRIACLRAVAGDPKILFADEPISNLDNDNAKNLFNFLKKHKNEDQTLLVINHNIEATYDFLDPDYYFYMEKKSLEASSHKIQLIPKEKFDSFYQREEKKWIVD